MPDTPGLTDEQIDAMRPAFRSAYAEALPRGHDAAGEWLFDSWLAAVEARAVRRERVQILATAARVLMPLPREDGTWHSTDSQQYVRLLFSEIARREAVDDA